MILKNKIITNLILLFIIITLFCFIPYSYCEEIEDVEFVENAVDINNIVDIENDVDIESIDDIDNSDDIDNIESNDNDDVENEIISEPEFFIDSSQTDLLGSVTQVLYKTHIQNIGWENDYKTNGETSGTEGRSFRLEGIKIKLNSSNSSDKILYQTHIQNIGWQEWKSNDEMSGTEGKSYRLEAIRIKLEGNISNNYDIYYRVHAQNFGWLDWASNGGTSGTSGYGYRLEAIQIVLVSKGGAAPGNTSNPYREMPSVIYKTHIQNIGTQGYVSNGATSGSEGKGLRLEGIYIDIANNTLLSGGITYQTHIQNIGWQGWKSNNEMSGTSNKGLRLEGIRIKLTGELATKYDIYYRVHAQNFGWLDWAKNGIASGTSGYSYRLEAIQIVILPKGSSSPGSTAKPFRERMTYSITSFNRYTTMKVGQKLQVTYACNSTPVIAANANPVFEALNPTLGTITNSGLVIAHKAGVANFLMKDQEGNYSGGFYIIITN